jgi:hypothetical protein
MSAHPYHTTFILIFQSQVYIAILGWTTTTIYNKEDSRMI